MMEGEAPALEDLELERDYQSPLELIIQLQWVVVAQVV
jgi:hypothetical protein